MGGKQLKACSVYFSKEWIFVFTEYIVEDGVYFDAGPKFKLPLKASELELEDTIRRALDASVEGAQLPKDLGQIKKEVLRFVGLKSWRAFEQSVKYVSVLNDGELFEVQAYKNVDRGGFLASSDVPARKCTFAEIAMSVIEATADCGEVRLPPSHT